MMTSSKNAVLFLILLLLLFVFLNNLKFMQTAAASPPNATLNKTESIFSRGSPRQLVITGCTEVSKPGTYYLVKNIEVNKPGPCINVTAEGVTLNGNNYLIHSDSFAGPGIYSNKPRTYIKDVDISMSPLNGIGIQMLSANNSIIENGIFYAQSRGMHLNNIYGIIIKNVTIKDNYGLGIYASKIYNSLLENNLILNNSRIGVQFSDGKNNLLINNEASYNGWSGHDYDGSSGFDLAQVHNSTFIDNTANWNTFNGFYFIAARNNTLKNTIAGDNERNGIRFDVGFDNNLHNSYFLGNDRGGIRFAGSSRNYFYNTTIQNAGWNGIWFTTFSNNNSIIGAKIDSAAQNGLLFQESNKYNIIKDVEIINTNISFFDVSLDPNNTNIFIDSPFSTYNFVSPGTTLTIEDSENGRILFLEPVLGSGREFYNLVSVRNNLAIISSKDGSLNAPTEIIFYNMPGTFINPGMFKDDTLCVSCRNLTSLNAEIVIFNAPEEGRYYIGEM